MSDRPPPTPVGTGRKRGRQGQSPATAGVDGRALGTGLRVVVTQPGLLAEAKAAVDSVLVDVDLACSRFREDSELVALNARAGRETVVSPLLALAIEAGLRAARLTDGDVDPTVGVAMRLIGYDVTYAAVPADGAPLSLLLAPVPGWRTVRFNRVSRSVSFPDGVEIDLGATAKALAADLCVRAALATLNAGGGALVSLGGDIAMAGVPPPGGWAIQVSDDSNAGIDPMAERIVLAGGGIATSSTQVRRWRRGGVELHHIIDPRTGAPAAGPWRLASVVADSCVDANIASTAAIVRGAAAHAWLTTLGLPARLSGHDGSVIRTSGWPEPQA